MIQLTKENFQAEVLASDKPVLVDFYADWCGPCKMQGPIVEELSEEAAATHKVCKLNVEEQASLATQYDVSSIPTLLLFAHGEVKGRLVGYQSKILVQNLMGLV